MKTEQLQTLKKRLAELTPSGWRARLTTRGGRWVIYTISEAPVDLLALDAVAYPGQPSKGYVKICPTAYEQPWDEASVAVIAIWRELCAASPLRELWVGTPGKAFAVIEK